MNMGKHFKVNDNLFYDENPQVKNNKFICMESESAPLPRYEDIADLLPRPVWDGHDDVIRCNEFVWKTAFGNLRRHNKEAGFVSDFIDTAFNGYLFMWDSSFIMMFARYASRAFNFQRTLDNFYSHQHKDGFICREICEDENGEQFARDDPASTGPNILPWAEWEYFCTTGDKERLGMVFDPLCAYYKWLQLHRTWQDGGYWSCGFACGMDNQPRQQAGYNPFLSHGFMTWIDTCAQQYLGAEILVKMADVLGRSSEVEWLRQETALLGKKINWQMWDEKTGFYYDTLRDGSFSGVKTVGTYWTMLSNLASSERAGRLVEHLENKNEFNLPHRIPALSADHPDFSPDGGYWCGAVWAPTNYMVLKGLEKYGYHDLAHEIACNTLLNVTRVFNETGTVWENYSPTESKPGNPAKRDFVGWTGLIPVSVLFENVFGITPHAEEKRIEWRINLTERHGVINYPLGTCTVDLTVKQRKSADERPEIEVKTDGHLTVDVIWNSEKETYFF